MYKALLSRFPRKAAGVTDCCVRQLPAPVLPRVIAVEEDLHAVGLGFDASWGLLSTERAKLPGASFDLPRERGGLRWGVDTWGSPHPEDDGLGCFTTMW